MGDQKLLRQAVPPTPPAGTGDIYVDDISGKLAQIVSDGSVHGAPLSNNFSVASLSIPAADTYITNSGILVPSFGMQAGQVYRWRLTATKTAAGTAAAVYTIRIGSAQSTADTSRLALTATTAQTAAVSSGIIDVFVLVQTIGASGVIAGGVGVQSNNAGLGSGISGASAGFDNRSLGGSYVGLSINNGASGAWTIETCYAELVA